MRERVAMLNTRIKNGLDEGIRSSSNGLKKVKNGDIWMSVFQAKAVAHAKALRQEPSWPV